jgi:hypothetical protein
VSDEEKKPRVLLSPLAAGIRARWPNTNNRNAVLAEYSTLGKNKFMLTDVALLGGLYASTALVSVHRANSEFENGVAAGRRELANDIITLAGERADRIRELIEKL